MKRLLFIALLVVFACEVNEKIIYEEQEEVYGCTDSTACNFYSDATIYVPNSCIYELDCNNECGTAVEDICNTCDSDTTNDCIVSSIEEGEDISTNAGLIIQFSNSMDLNIFEADTIITSINFSPNEGELNVDSVGLIGNFLLPIIKIQNSNYIKLNNEPQTFYYDPSTFTCAFIQTTNEWYPDGTGEGFNIQEGNNEFIIGDLYSLNFYGINSYGIKVVPNPFMFRSYYAEQSDMLVRFTNLPQYCVINILTSTGELVKTLEHESEDIPPPLGSESEWWSLKNDDGEDIDAGIYRYEVVFESNTFTNGVMVIER